MIHNKVAQSMDDPDDDGAGRRFFQHAKSVAESGQFDYAIEMYMQGLGLDPENLQQHKALRELSLNRKTAGGKPMGMFERRKYATNTRDSRQNVLNAERLLAFEPENIELLAIFRDCAAQAGEYEISRWADELFRATDEPNEND